jgi:hypothetical protein
MVAFTRSDELREAEFTGTDLTGARFVESDLSGVVMRAVDVQGADIDAPWLDGAGSLRVNGVNVAPFVDAELNRRFPGRAGRHAADPDGLRAAWAALERTWPATYERAAAMPAGTVDEQPFHPIRLWYTGAEEDGMDMSAFATVTPPYAEVLQVRAGRVAMVRDYLAAVTSEVLAAPRKNPYDPGRQMTIRSCLHVILREEWEHLRYAVRDLDAIEAESAG